MNQIFKLFTLLAFVLAISIGGCAGDKSGKEKEPAVQEGEQGEEEQIIEEDTTAVMDTVAAAMETEGEMAEEEAAEEGGD